MSPTKTAFNPFESEESELLTSKYACTIVSLLPFTFTEDRPHMLPGTFTVPAAKEDDIAILHVEESVFWIPNVLIEEGKPGSSIKQTTSPAQMAASICNDYKGSHIALGEDAEPGVFWVEHRLTKEQVKKFHADKIREALRKQKNWFKNLIALADVDWNKNHNAMAVSDLQRAAAKSLGVKRDWIEVVAQENIQCPYCKTTIPVGSIKCMNCKEIVDQVAYKAMQDSMGVS